MIGYLISGFIGYLLGKSHKYNIIDITKNEYDELIKKQEIANKLFMDDVCSIIIRIVFAGAIVTVVTLFLKYIGFI